jgi:hypothetical protein
MYARSSEYVTAVEEEYHCSLSELCFQGVSISLVLIKKGAMNERLSLMKKTNTIEFYVIPV